jgi:hypothetical protein
MNDFQIDFPVRSVKRIKNTSAAVRARGSRRNNVTTGQGLGAAAAGISLIPGGAIVAGVIGLGAALNSILNANSMPLPAASMWLCAYYQYWVLGQSAVTSDHNANAIYYAPAVQWFSSFCGVPVVDINQLWSLKGTNSSLQTQNFSLATREKNYRTSIVNSNTGLQAIMNKVAPTNVAAVALSSVPSIPSVNVQLACLLTDALETPAQLGGHGIPAYWAQVYDTQSVLVQNAIAGGQLNLPPAQQAATNTVSAAPATTATVVQPNPLTAIVGTIQQALQVPATLAGEVTDSAPSTGAVLTPAGTVQTTASTTNYLFILLIVAVIAYMLFR